MLKYPMIIPDGAFQAYLYDCDGTLADTMEAHIDAWVEELATHGVKLDGALIHELAGMTGTLTVLEINRRYHVNLDPETIAKAKEERFFKQYLHRITPIVTVVEHLKQSAARGIKIAVVSGGRKRVVKETLNIIGVETLVQALVCAEDVKRGKPDPEPFLSAAELLGVKPEHCLVFEDADLGVKSAENAGMKWVRVEALAK